MAVALLLPALLVAAGVAVDGAERARASRVAHAAASQAARVGCEEGSAAMLLGRDGSDAAASRASHSVREALADEDARTRVSVAGDAVSVRAEVSRPTRLLSLIGLTTVRGSASVSCRLVPR